MKISIASDSCLIRQISERLIDELKKKGAEEDTIFDIRVGFEEAVRNAIVHGNRSSAGKKVNIETEISGKEVVIRIEDEGSGFDPESVEDPTFDKNLLKEGGRGVYLIKRSMDEVRYERGGRRVVMIKSLAGRKERREKCV
jgi:serine/threonine-protein kinase RsbW